MNLLRKFFTLIFFLFLSGYSISLSAQELKLDSSKLSSQLNIADQKTIIQDIVILGNRKTNKRVILREIPFQKGDSIIKTHLPFLLKEAQELIYNTKLFVTVEVQPIQTGEQTTRVFITVKERWYTYPLPYLELSDRSLNEWIHTHHANFRWVSYGMYFIQENFSGNRDRLELKAVAGFNKSFFFEYTAPSINAALTDGFRLSGGLDIPRETRYITSPDNKLMYYRGENPVSRKWFGAISYISRKRMKKKEMFTLNYTHIRATDSIAKFYNPEYFGNAKDEENYIELAYKLQYDDVDNIIYPLDGNTFQLKAEKRGLGWKGGPNRLLLESQYHIYKPLGKQWYSEYTLAGQLKLPFSQPYLNLTALGYAEHYLRGYEYFVIDGPAFAYLKGTLKKKITNFRLPTLLKSKTYNTIPFTIYAKVYSDLGYVYSKNYSLLGNRLLWSGGLGLDIVTLYDFAVKLEFSWNQLGQKGLFLHK